MSTEDKNAATGKAAGVRGKADNYTADQIEVLEGLEAVRRHPGMYIGGTDDRALHHLFAEILDNSVDEAVAGYATKIAVVMHDDGSVEVVDNGRGIPFDPHPKFKKKSALEVIFTTLHAGGKFSGKAYETSGGLHGVGSSVVNALSSWMTVEVARDKKAKAMTFREGIAGKLEDRGAASNRRGTSVRFMPDPKIFGAKAQFTPGRVFRMTRSKAFLEKGVEIRWNCAASLIKEGDDTPEKAVLSFPGGLKDYLETQVTDLGRVVDAMFHGESKWTDDQGRNGRMEWAIVWTDDPDGDVASFCNTIPTSEGGTHETGLRAGLTRSIRNFGDMVGQKKIKDVVADDVLGGAHILLSLFIPDPAFSNQTKEKLVTPGASKHVDGEIKDHFDNWLGADAPAAKKLLESIIERSEERLRKRKDKDLKRQSATRKLRLPGKLADCSKNSRDDTELFIVEGDSAGGSAKQARKRENQAILPLRGKILNVASASEDKLRANAELSDLLLAMGVQRGKNFDLDDLRYERIIIMTDADVDGAHIASLLMTFFYQELPGLIESGRLYLAAPPLYRLGQGGKTLYARDDAHKDELVATEFRAGSKVDISRFKGLGEMSAGQLKETTMDPNTRTLLRVNLPDVASPKAPNFKAVPSMPSELVEALMGKKADSRFHFIQANAAFADDLDV